MSLNRLSSRFNLSFARTLLSAAFLLGCSGEPMPTDTSPSTMEDQAIKALKDKFYSDHNCDVYQKIVVFNCDSGVVQAMCKDTMGNTQVDYYLKDPSTNTSWFSEQDIDNQITAVQAQLTALQMKKAGFAPAHTPGYQCNML